MEVLEALALIAWVVGLRTGPVAKPRPQVREDQHAVHHLAGFLVLR